MAQSLFDILGSSSQPSKAAPTDSGKQFFDIASTGMSGKEQSAGATPKASALGERAALNEVQLKLDQVADTAKTQAATQQMESAQIKERQSTADKQLDQDTLTKRSQLSNETSDLLQQFEQGKATLDYNKDAAKIEQLGTNLRLADDKYVFNLQQEGDRARLDNDIAFKEQLAADVFSEYEDMARGDAAFAMLMQSNQNEFNMALQNMSLEDALAMAEAQDEAQTQAARMDFITGAGALKSGGVQQVAGAMVTRGAGPKANTTQNAGVGQSGVDPSVQGSGGTGAGGV